MNIMGSAVLFIIFIMAYFTIIEVFTVLFRLTGLTYEKAKTQVISMLTNSGFTTTESEIILVSKMRRKLAQMTMLFGYSFTVIIVSVIVNVFLALNQAEIRNIIPTVALMLLILCAILLIMRLKLVRASFDRLIEKLGNRVMFGRGSNTVVLIDYFKGLVMVEIHLKIVPHFLCGVSLADTQLRKRYNIQVLFIKRGGSTMQEIDGETVLLANDIVFLFGDYKNIRTIFEHPDIADKAAD